MNEKLLEGLNSEQLEAVTHRDGPLLIIAGAGTGKTSVITRRLAYLIAQGLARPEEILALTFTDKAAAEMAERVDRLMPYGYTELNVLTFHSFAEKVLPKQKLLDETEMLLFLRRNWQRFSLDYYKSPNPNRYLPDIADHLSRLKDENISAARYLELAESIQDPDERKRLLELARLYQLYQELLEQHGFVDFADLMMGLHRALTHDPQLRETLTKRYRYVLVDEFQDTNSTQYEIIKLLATHENLAVVGDDDQSIYRFRGAGSSNLSKFLEDFSGAKKVILTRNYRSRQEVLDAAQTLIQWNAGRIEKKLTGCGPGGLVEELVFETEADEAYGVADKILELKKLRPELSWNEFCILFRANNSALPFVQTMERKGIPFRFYGLQGLYTKPVILDILSFCKVVVDAYDNVAMTRVLASGAVGLNDDELMRLTFESQKQGKPLYEIAKSESKLEPFLQKLKQASLAARSRKAAEAFLVAVRELNILAYLNGLEESHKTESLNFLDQFYQRVLRFERTAQDPFLAQFLEEINHELELGESGNLRFDPSTGPDFVRLMTVHASKGLEFEYVFVVHLVEQRFPSVRRNRGIPIPPGLLASTTNIEAQALDEHLAEERRLLYVALTRAKQAAYLTRALDYGGERKKKPSRFLVEMGLTSPSLPESKPKLPALEIQEGPQLELSAPQAPKRLSFTQLMAFESCPLQYKYAHIYHIPIYGSAASSFGKTMHATLCEFLKNYRNLSVPDLLKIYESIWIDEWYPDDRTREEYRAKGRVALLEVHDRTHRGQPDAACLEQEFTLPLGEIVVKGRIDRIDRLPDGTYEIIDYKTGKPKTEEQLAKDREARKQLALYALAAERVLKIPVGKLTYYYLENNSGVSFVPKPDELQKLEDEIVRIAKAIARTDFLATPGFHCKTCDFRSICQFRQV